MLQTCRRRRRATLHRRLRTSRHRQQSTPAAGCVPSADEVILTGAKHIMVRRCSPRAGFTSRGVRFARAGDTSIWLAGTSPVVDDDLRMPAAMPAFVPSASPTAFRGSFVRKRQRLRPPRWTSQRVTATEATTAPTSRMFVIRAIYREAGSTSVKDVEVLLPTPWQLTNPWPTSTAEDCR